MLWCRNDNIWVAANLLGVHCVEVNPIISFYPPFFPTTLKLLICVFEPFVRLLLSLALCILKIFYLFTTFVGEIDAYQNEMPIYYMHLICLKMIVTIIFVKNCMY